VIPPWLRPLVGTAARARAEDLSRFVPPAHAARHSAVLLLLGEGAAGPDLLLIERSPDLRSHAGQPAFPGGRIDPADAGPVAAALREAAEETGLDPGGVDVVATLPALWLPASGYVVHPVLGWWREPSEVAPVDPAEVVAVERVPVGELADPANRLQVRHPSGYIGPAFTVRGLLVWGFTAGLVDRLLALAGWERPWDSGRVEDLPAEVLRLAARTAARSDDASATT
jgi:8-oxo-dGTP pyrophosphatase MutT (NUDIX family)